MDTGAPMPAIHVSDEGLFVAYIVSEPMFNGDLEEFAIVEFCGVLQHTFGYPNDEALGGHPLYSSGLQFYEFNEVLESPYVTELGRRNAMSFPGTEQHYDKFRHWIVTFHDETLEVIGTTARVRGRLEAVSGLSALCNHVT